VIYLSTKRLYSEKLGFSMILRPFIILFFLLIICSLPIVNSSLDTLQKVTAQTNTTTSTSSAEGAKVLVDDAMEALKNKDVNKAVVHLNMLNQQLSAIGNLSSIQSVKVLLDDATLALKNGDANKAVVHLNLINQQLATLTSGIAISPPLQPSTPSKQITPSSPSSSQINKIQTNYPPKAHDYNTTMITGVPVSFVLPADDIENDPLTFSIKSNTSHGEIRKFSPADGAVTYASSPGYSGTDSFGFQVSDNHNQSSNIAQVSIIANTPPTAAPPSTEGWDMNAG
jgi:Bacterial Ig domain